jgi:DNA-binding NarL/FixJ family response regulator
MPIRVLIADDHPETRKAVRDLLQTHPGWEICAEAVDGVEAVDKAISLRPDLVVLDLSMPRMNGLQAARSIHTAAPEIPLILFSIHGAESRMIPEFQSAGFRGAVSKSTAWLLPEAIESLLQDRTFFPPRP